MSLVSKRRALFVTGLSGMLLAGGALASSTAAFADDGSSGDSSSSASVTIADAADAAQSKYPDCDVTAALLYESGDTPAWDVEMTCDSGTVKYLSVDANDGTATNKGSTTDDDGSDKDSSTGDSDKDTSTDDNDAPGTGANTDYS